MALRMDLPLPPSWRGRGDVDQVDQLFAREERGRKGQLTQRLARATFTDKLGPDGGGA
jgi:hypothetical protein